MTHWKDLGKTRGGRLETGNQQRGCHNSQTMTRKEGLAWHGCVWLHGLYTAPAPRWHSRRLQETSSSLQRCSPGALGTDRQRGQTPMTGSLGPNLQFLSNSCQPNPYCYHKLCFLYGRKWQLSPKCIAHHTLSQLGLHFYSKESGLKGVLRASKVGKVPPPNGRSLKSSKVQRHKGSAC